MSRNPYPKNIANDEDEAIILNVIDRFLEKDVKKFADSLSRFLYNHCGWRLKDDGKWPREKRYKG